MPHRFPPRREPRVLAIASDARRLLWAVVDPWEIRGTGRMRCSAAAQALAVVRLLRREHPTVVVIARRRNFGILRLAAPDANIPILPASFPLVPVGIAVELFPELPLLAPTSALRAVTVHAISAVLHGQFPSRKYAPSCHRTILRRP